MIYTNETHNDYNQGRESCAGTYRSVKMHYFFKEILVHSDDD